MQADGSRRPRRRRSALLVAGALLAITGVATGLVLTAPRLELVAPPALTNDPSPKMELRLAHPGSVEASDVTATIDGAEIAAARIDVLDDGARIIVRVPSQADGEHQIVVTVKRAGLLRLTRASTHAVTIDTVAPATNIVQPAAPARATSAYDGAGIIGVTRQPMRLVVGAEPGTTLEVTSSAEGVEPVRAEPSEDVRRTIDITLAEGMQVVTATATDPAGNATARSTRVLVDTAGPIVSIRVPAVVRDRALNLRVASRDPHGVSITASLDGVLLEEGVATASSTPAPHPAPALKADAKPVDADTATASETPPPIQGVYTITVADGAYEGRHVLEIVAKDTLGNTTVTKRSFLVDSTEALSETSGLRPGARGADVVELQKSLIEEKAGSQPQLAGDMGARSYGAATRRAVQAFQQREGLDVDGIAGAGTIAALTLEIVIDRGNHRLTLYRTGQVVKSWGIAVGSAQYPTPAGDFEVQSMQKDPTWTPPDSDWAKDAEVTPPGPDNPLGTRWMAINGTVGIHGTNSPESIGYSVSHGCIRMAIPDVEELFDMVHLGTRVRVV